MPNEHFIDTPFLPYGYNVPVALEECYTWETVIAWLCKKIKDLEDRVEELEGENTNE